MTWHPDMPEEYKNQIVTGDARELAKRIPDESIDLIFTDPPYPKEFLYLYSELAMIAARVLRPSGFLLAMCGQTYLPQIFSVFEGVLDYHWIYEVEMTGWAAGVIWRHGNTKVNIVQRCKPILAYSKGVSLPRTSTLGLFPDGGGDKRYHVWGQHTSSARYFLDCFSEPAAIILDPYVGGGTTVAAAKLLRRNYIAFEIDPDTAELARERVRNTQPPLFVMEPEQLDLLDEDGLNEQN